MNLSVKISIIHDFYLQSKGDYVGMGLKIFRTRGFNFLGGGGEGCVFLGGEGVSTPFHAMEVCMPWKLKYMIICTPHMCIGLILLVQWNLFVAKKKFLNLGEQIVATLHLSPFSNFCTRKYGGASLLLLFFLQQNNCMISEKWVFWIFFWRSFR